MKAKKIILKTKKGIEFAKVYAFDKPWLRWNDSQCRVPFGECYIDETKIFINKQDLYGLKEDTSKTEGCCGSDGGTPTLFDDEGAIIGFEFNDCWLSHCIMIRLQDIVILEDQINDIDCYISSCKYEEKRLILERVSGNDVDLKLLKERSINAIKGEITETIEIEQAIQSLKVFKVITLEQREKLIEAKDEIFLFTKYR